MCKIEFPDVKGKRPPLQNFDSRLGKTHKYEKRRNLDEATSNTPSSKIIKIIRKYVQNPFRATTWCPLQSLRLRQAHAGHASNRVVVQIRRAKKHHCGSIKRPQGPTNRQTSPPRIKERCYFDGVAGELAAGVFNPASPQMPCYDSFPTSI